jgi:hypothetical protein
MVGLFRGSLELNLPLVPLTAFNITGHKLVDIQIWLNW